MASYCCGGSCSSEAGCGTGCYNVCSGDGATSVQCPTLGSGGESGGGSSCTCSGNCKGECKNSCGTSCSENCKTDNATELYKKLLSGLNKKIYAADMQNINDMIQIQAHKNRYNKKTTSVTFSKSSKISSSKIAQLQKNVNKLGDDTEENVNQGVKAKKVAGQELIDLVLEAADEKITSSSSKD